MEILQKCFPVLLTSVLAMSCDDAPRNLGQDGQQATPFPSQVETKQVVKNTSLQASHPNGYAEAFSISTEAERETLQITINEKIRLAVSCNTDLVLTKGPLNFTKGPVPREDDVVYLSDKVFQAPDINAATVFGLEYDQGKMIDGFFVTGICPSDLPSLVNKLN